MAGHAHEAYLAAVGEPMHAVDELPPQRFLLILEDHTVELFDLELREPALHGVLEEISAPGRSGHHDSQLVAVPGGEGADGPHHVAPLEQGQVEVIDAVLMKRLLDGGGGYSVAGRQADPAHHHPCPAEGDPLLKVHSRPPYAVNRHGQDIRHRELSARYGVMMIFPQERPSCR